jgi:hypothetical protein
MDKGSGRVKADNANKLPFMTKADEDREKRLAEALRANLRRRKANPAEIKPPPR